MQGFQGAQYLWTTDLSFDIRGPMHVSFSRAFHNRWGKHRAEYIHTTETWSNNIGRSWTHNLNVFLSVSQTATGGVPDNIVYYDGVGNLHFFYYSSHGIGVDYFTPSVKSPTEMQAMQIVRNTTSGACVLQFSHGQEYAFAMPTANGICKILTATDSFSNTITYAYNTAGRLTKVYGPSPDTRYLYLEYSGNQITKASIKKDTSVLQSVSYAYNADYGLASITDVDGGVTQYTYSWDSRDGETYYIASWSDTANRTTTYSYTYDYHPDGWGLHPYTVVTTHPDGVVDTLSRQIASGYNEATMTTTYLGTTLAKVRVVPGPQGYYPRYYDIFTGAGSWTTYERWEYQYYDNLNDGISDNDRDLYKVIDPRGVTVAEFAWTTLGRISSIKHPGQPATTFSYPTNGLHATKRTHPDGTETNYYYDSYDRLTKEVTPWSGSNGYQRFFDSYGQLTAVMNPLGNATTYAYDSVGKITTITNALNKSYTLEYDDLGFMTKRTSPLNQSAYFYYSWSGSGCSCASGGRITKVKDAENNETLFAYDISGNLAKVTDALNRATDFYYGANNELTAIVSPSGSTNETTFEYDLLTRLTKITDVNGKEATAAYDHVGRVTSTSDQVGTVTFTYDSSGNLSTVKDALNHIWDYDYDTNSYLTTVTDPVTKYVKYFYDSYGRLTKVGAGSSGTFDPTEYFYNSANGVLTKVRYTDGANARDEIFEFDGMLRITKLKDWIDATNGIQYAYDAGNRLTKITDYDASTLDYSYDDIGRVTAQNDYHGYDTAYTYTTRDQLSTITAPGSKTWDFDYNALGQPTGYTHPNGIATNYAYDTRNRMTKIEHLDGTTALESFTYALDTGGLITRTTEVDGSYWDYAYDNRYRLTSAHLKNSGGTIDAPFTYTYDAGDNMLTKVEPFFDDFNDGNYTGWYMSNGTWSATNNVLSSTGTGAPIASLTNTDADNETVLRYRIDNTSDSLTRAYIYPRFTDWSNHLWVRIFPGAMDIYKIVGGTATQLASVSTTSTQGAWYNLRIVCDGNNMDVYRWADGNMPTKILSSTSANYTSTSYFKIVVQTGFLFSFDDIRVLANSLSNTTTFAVNNANELTGMTDYNGTTSFAFDGWGRMTSKSLGSYSATYGYKYGQMLCSVTSNFPGEGSVTYNYGGNGQRREKISNSITTKYNWNGAFGLINEEDNAGNLTRSYTGRLCEISGNDPSSGTPRFHHYDQVGSVRLVTDNSSDTTMSEEFTPFGKTFEHAGERATWSYASLNNTDSSGRNHGFYRTYSADTCRWNTQDPMGMVDSTNLYSYVAGNPVNSSDPLGLTMLDCMGNALGGYGPSGGSLPNLGMAWPGIWDLMPNGWPSAGYSIPVWPIPGKVPQGWPIPPFLKPWQARGGAPMLTSLASMFGPRGLANWLKSPLVGNWPRPTLRPGQALILGEGAYQAGRIGYAAYQCS